MEGHGTADAQSRGTGWDGPTPADRDCLTEGNRVGRGQGGQSGQGGAWDYWLSRRIGSLPNAARYKNGPYVSRNESN